MKKALILSAILAAGCLCAQKAGTVIQDSDFSYESNAAKVEDSAASDKSTGKMDVSRGWTMKYFVPAKLAGDKEVIVSLRSDVKDPKGYSSIGIYDKKKKQIVLAKRIKVADYAGTEYKELSLGKWKFTDQNYIFITSLTPKSAQKGFIYIDKITFKGGL